MTEDKHKKEENSLIAERRRKLDTIRLDGNPFPNDFRRTALAQELFNNYGEYEDDDLRAKKLKVAVAGRMMVKRVMGKASFIKLQDHTGQIQIRLERDRLPKDVYQAFKKWDVGDILGATGSLFKTKTGELTVIADETWLLTKSLRPLPEKFHGLADQELRYRRRYVDLIMNEQSREVFRRRSEIITYIRRFLDDQNYLEVETPMLQTTPGGAVARPFETYHNALNMDMYLRVAPELNLKRLIVGGFDRVYEINRNFRNEGVSTQHNPEFTMLELYQAYADYKDIILMFEGLFKGLARSLLGTEKVLYQGETYDFSKPFNRLTVEEVILQFNTSFDRSKLRDVEYLRHRATESGIKIQDSYGAGKLQLEIFEKTCEEQLRQPTFVLQYPTEVSPLSRKNDDDPFVTDRFELFIGGREFANGFSELNDPEDQEERFQAQALNRNAGDLEALVYDADYIRAMEYGLPPVAGVGLGIDRVVMLFTDSPSIRDVLLFPHMRAEVFD
ncbi:MAG: lysine--tRNA ligase [Woeseia sp.]|nr:lysine--tRNA ligase [Woeseia sp.]